jgi:hypothetical protein
VRLSAESRHAYFAEALFLSSFQRLRFALAKTGFVMQSEWHGN